MLVAAVVVVVVVFVTVPGINDFKNKLKTHLFKLAFDIQ